MEILDWAKREIDILNKDSVNEYSIKRNITVYKALELLTSLDCDMYSIRRVQNMLDRLINWKHLTEITEEDFTNYPSNVAEPEEYLKDRGLKSSIMCDRYSPLFREEYLDGRVVYKDVMRTVCFGNNNIFGSHFGIADEIVDKMYPITIPYYPSLDNIEVYWNSFLTNKDNGDFDTCGIFYLIKDGERVEINRFFKAERRI